MSRGMVMVVINIGNISLFGSSLSLVIVVGCGINRSWGLMDSMNDFLTYSNSLLLLLSVNNDWLSNYNTLVMVSVNNTSLDNWPVDNNSVVVSVDSMMSYSDSLLVSVNNDWLSNYNTLVMVSVDSMMSYSDSVVMVSVRRRGPGLGRSRRR